MIQLSSYNPISFEMNITPVVRELIAKNKHFNLSLPIVTAPGEPLVFREYKEGDTLAQSSIFKVMEPLPSKKRVYPQVIIVPLMGFIEDCHRLGYGGGFYDRSIAQMKELYNGHVLTIGVAFEAQKFDSFSAPAEERGEKCSKVSKMREKFENNQSIKWVQLDTD